MIRISKQTEAFQNGEGFYQLDTVYFIELRVGHYLSWPKREIIRFRQAHQNRCLQHQS
jgi:hypothetical protein